MLRSAADDSLMYRVGKMYELGLGTQINLPKAIKLFQEAGELKNTFALFSLAKLYLKSDDSELHKKAVQILTDLHRERPDDDMISYSLGKVYLNETRFYDVSKAIEYFKKSADSENQFAQYQLGKIYSSENFGNPNYSLAISYLEASALQGNDFALYQLGVLYKNFDLEFYNIDKAIDYFKDSAGLGNQFAEYQLGRLYSNKDSPIYDMDLAISYLMAAANKDNSFAQLQLGIIYLWGKGVKLDVTLGTNFLNQAIHNGNPFAQQILDSYETYRLQFAMNISYKLFSNIFSAITNVNDRNSTIAADRYFRNLSKKAMIEKQLKNPHKHNHEPNK